MFGFNRSLSTCVDMRDSQVDFAHPARSQFLFLHLEQKVLTKSLSESRFCSLHCEYKSISNLSEERGDVYIVVDNLIRAFSEVYHP